MYLIPIEGTLKLFLTDKIKWNKFDVHVVFNLLLILN